MVVRTLARRNVRILLVGERGVGKTSLILALASEDFPEDVPTRAEEITIPADVTPEKVPTNIVDYSALDQTDDNLFDEIAKAHVICVVYSVVDEESFNKVCSYWLPLIRELRLVHRCPIVLVGNKADLSEFDTIDSAISLMEDYPEIESCVECSAKTLKNISEMFYYAQRAVLHPTMPVFDSETEELTDACKKALTRIFKICDLDNDNLLNDMELNNFQKLCFSINLQPQTLDEVKAVLMQCPNNDGISHDAVTLNGFLYLHKLFMLRARNETIWSVLRRFGYDEHLNYSTEYLRPKLKVPSGCSVELSQKGHIFLNFIFQKYDKKSTGYLSKRRLKDMFSVCPQIPWDDDLGANVTKIDKNGAITQQGFINHWVMMTFYDPFRTIEYLAYLGYNSYDNECQTSAVHVTRDKKIDLAKKQSSRNVYVCHVIGSKNSGKSSLCQCFLKNEFEKLVYKPSSHKHKHTVNNVQIYAQEKYLILREISLNDVSDPLTTQEVNCDVACLVYDRNNPRSFEFIARIFIKYFADSNIPVLIVSNKCDLEEVRQEYTLQPPAFCSRYKIVTPQPFSAIQKIKKDVFVKLATMAAFPPLSRIVHLMYMPKPIKWVQLLHSHLKQFGSIPKDTHVWWKAGLSFAAVTALGFIFVKAVSVDRIK